MMPKRVRISSQEQLDKEMKQALLLFTKKETDETWEQFATALKNIAQWALEDNVHQYDSFAGHMKSLQNPIIKALKTERTRLSGSATDLLKTLSQVMKRDYEPLHLLFAPTLIDLFGRTNKILMKRAVECYLSAIEHSKMPKSIPRLCTVLRTGKEQNSTVRQHVVECITKMIQINTVADVLRFMSHIEGAIAAAAMDKSKDVRQSVQKCYKVYCTKLPEQAIRFNAELRPDAKKYLTAAQSTTRHSLPLRRPSSLPRPARASMPAISRSSLLSKPKTERAILPAASSSDHVLERRPKVESPSEKSSPSRIDHENEDNVSLASVSPLADTKPSESIVSVSPPHSMASPLIPSTTPLSPPPSQPILSPSSAPQPTPSTVAPIICAPKSPEETPAPTKSLAPVPKPLAQAPVNSNSNTTVTKDGKKNYKYLARFSHMKSIPGTQLPKLSKPFMLSGTPMRPIKRKMDAQGIENQRPPSSNTDRIKRAHRQ